MTIYSKNMYHPYHISYPFSWSENGICIFNVLGVNMANLRESDWDSGPRTKVGKTAHIDGVDSPFV